MTEKNDVPAVNKFANANPELIQKCLKFERLNTLSSYNLIKYHFKSSPIAKKFIFNTFSNNINIYNPEWITIELFIFLSCNNHSKNTLDMFAIDTNIINFIKAIKIKHNHLSYFTSKSMHS